MTLPTREEVEAVRKLLATVKESNAEFTSIGVQSLTALALCDLALRVLDAPERDALPSERALYGTCPMCGARDRIPCHGRTSLEMVSSVNATDAHMSRLSAAPRRVRLVPVP